MTRALSCYLNAARLGCAVIVLIWHWSGFSGNAALAASQIGIDAVMVFFVLSGYVISYTAEHKDKALGVFAFNRATRIYSVAIPALAVSLGLFYLGNSLGLEHYRKLADFEPAEPYRALLNMVFLGELWGFDFRLQSNGPYWSLNYEVWYYVLFGAAMFLRGRMKFAVAGIALLIMGPKLWLLLPIWLAGHVLYRFGKGTAVLDRRIAWLCFAAPPVIYAGLHVLDVPQSLRAWLTFMPGDLVMQQLIWNYMVGTLAAVNFFGAVRLFDGERAVPARINRTVTFFAGYTFSIYLFHMPFLMYFAHNFAYCADALDVPFTHPLIQSSFLAAVFGSCLVVGTVTERKKPQLRALVLFIHAKLSALRTKRARCST